METDCFSSDWTNLFEMSTDSESLGAERVGQRRTLGQMMGISIKNSQGSAAVASDVFNSYNVVFLVFLLLVFCAGVRFCYALSLIKFKMLMTFDDLICQVVLLSGHLDSWDVGQGAMDDGGGAMISWEALSLIKDLGNAKHSVAHAGGYVSVEKN